MLTELENQIIASIDTGCSAKLLLQWFVDGDHPSGFGEGSHLKERPDLASRDAGEIIKTIGTLIIAGFVRWDEGMLFVNYNVLKKYRDEGIKVTVSPELLKRTREEVAASSFMTKSGAYYAWMEMFDGEGEKNE